jgi:dGTPase
MGLMGALKVLEEDLAPYAAKANQAKRLKAESPPPCYRTAFQIDRDRIIHSKAFRRLAYKTQVLMAASGDHFRTRLTHTLEVSQIGRTLARALNLNEDLTEAGALGHDLGHTPFGHAGERTLSALCPEGFSHQRQSLRLVDILAKDGRGLNLTMEVRDAILKHSKGQGPIFASGHDSPLTMEGQLVRVADIIAYLGHDLDDAIEAGLISLQDVPGHIMEIFGARASSRIRAMVTDLLENSQACGQSLYLAFSGKMEKAMEDLRKFMLQRVYRNPKLKTELEIGQETIKRIYLAIMEDDDIYRKLPLRDLASSRSQAAADYIAGMTDRFAIRYCEALDMPAERDSPLGFTL